jgi:pimeloyl-ACP methyl ester carboxylesterase
MIREMDVARTSGIEKIAGLDIEIARRGRGRPVLFLHPHIGFWGAEPFIAALAKRAEVIAPSHPGFGRSALAKGMTTVDDLSYFYLDLVEQLDLRDAVLVGASFGGWIAAEIATKSCERLSRLVLIGAVGVKTGTREATDVVDIFATPRSRWEELSFHDPAFGRRDYAALPEEELAAMARNREATALFAWNPYMYDPKLLGRLHRIRIPTLFLWGASDRFAPAGYGRRYCDAVPGATFEEIANAGHFPHIEQPEATAARVAGFALAKHVEKRP